MDPAFADDLVKCGYSRDEVNRFQHDLRRSGKQSVDAFLEHRREYIPIGKAAIARALIPCEREELLFPSKEHWYEHLYAKMNASVDAFPANALSIVTLNYDRSLEHYLLTCLQSTYGIGPDHAAGIVKSIPIVHPHGQLGGLPLLSSLPGRPYVHDDIDPKVIALAAEAIRVAPEDSRGEFMRAHAILKAAHRVYFIGFGFAPDNVSRLGIPSTIQEKPGQVHGSMLDSTQQEQERVSAMFAKKINLYDWEALDFLRRAPALDSD